MARNRESGNLEIRVPVLGNHLFCAWLYVYFYRNNCQGLAASAVRSSLYKYFCRNYHSTCTKMDLKSDFHITGQLMENPPEYSVNLLKCQSLPSCRTAWCNWWSLHKALYFCNILYNWNELITKCTNAGTAFKKITRLCFVSK